MKDRLSVLFVTMTSSRREGENVAGSDVEAYKNFVDKGLKGRRKGK